MSKAKTHVLVLYGGRSAEHEISCRSAAFVLKNLDPEKYDVHAVAITQDGRWLPQKTAQLLQSIDGAVPIAEAVKHQPALPVSESAPTESLLSLVSADGATPLRTKDELVVFPVLHGSNGEDGTLQGLLDLSELSYVGPDTLGSSVGMDKVVAKKLAQAAQVPVVPWVAVNAEDWQEERAPWTRRIGEELGFPVFVKPVRLGSSVGISKVRTEDQLESACEEAFRFDERILVEKALDVREIECAVLGGFQPDVSVPGEVIPTAEFYSYDAKYVDENGAQLAIPTSLTQPQVETAQELSRRIFTGLELYGMARVDLFLERATGAFYFNEVNTIPGLTEISQFPLLWQESGLSPRELLDRLITLAQQRRGRRARLRRSR